MYIQVHSLHQIFFQEDFHEMWSHGKISVIRPHCQLTQSKSVAASAWINRLTLGNKLFSDANKPRRKKTKQWGKNQEIKIHCCRYLMDFIVLHHYRICCYGNTQYNVRCSFKNILLFRNLTVVPHFTAKVIFCCGRTHWGFTTDYTC